MTRPVRPQTIVVSANSFWNIVNFRRRLIEALTKEGYSVVVAAPAAEDGLELPHSLCRHEPLRVESDGLNPATDARLFIQYLRLIGRFRPKAYLSFTAKPNIYGALAARLRGSAPIPNVSGLGTAFIRGGVLQWLISSLYRVAFRGAPVVFFQNGEDRKLFVTNRIVRPEQARVLPGSGVDLDHFRPTGPVPGKDAGCVFLFVGRLLGDKGVREFVDAARQVKARHPTSSFRLLGFAGAANRTAITKEELAAWTGEGAVEYLGSVDDVRPHLASADAVVLPSYREGLPRSLLEAAAMGKPLIATDVPGNREVVEHKVNGLLCTVKSAASLAEACELFIHLPLSDREKMGEESRRMVEDRFSEQEVIHAYLDVIRSLERVGG